MSERSFKQIFGYNAIDAFKNAKTSTQRNSLAPVVDAQLGYMGQLETNKANAQLAQAQNDHNLMMWNKQNEYNSPTATMQRLTDAGINPRAYQNIGQFANASQPHQAERPEYDSPTSKLAKFSEKAQIDLAIKSQRLDAIKLAKDIALETTDKIRAYRELDETKRHNVANETLSQSRMAETERHNQALEAIQNVNLMMRDNEFRVALAKAGIKIRDDGSVFIPEEDIRLEEKYKHEVIDRLKKAGMKLETENDYLEQKKELENINTGVKWVDALARVLAAILKH